MSDARECDICRRLYATGPGQLSLDVYVTKGEQLGGSYVADTWTGVDLCSDCGADVLRLIKPALNGFAS